MKCPFCGKVSRETAFKGGQTSLSFCSLHNPYMPASRSPIHLPLRESPHRLPYKFITASDGYWERSEREAHSAVAVSPRCKQISFLKKEKRNPNSIGLHHAP